MDRNGKRERRRRNREPSVLDQLFDRVDADEIEQGGAQIQHAPEHTDEHPRKDRLQSQFPGDVEVSSIVGNNAPVLVSACDQRVRDKEPTERHEKQEWIGRNPRRSVPFQRRAPNAVPSSGARHDNHSCRPHRQCGPTKIAQARHGYERREKRDEKKRREYVAVRRRPNFVIGRKVKEIKREALEESDRKTRPKNGFLGLRRSFRVTHACPPTGSTGTLPQVCG